MCAARRGRRDTRDLHGGAGRARQPARGGLRRRSPAGLREQAAHADGASVRGYGGRASCRGYGARRGPSSRAGRRLRHRRRGGGRAHRRARLAGDGRRRRGRSGERRVGAPRRRDPPASEPRRLGALAPDARGISSCPQQLAPAAGSRARTGLDSLRRRASRPLGRGGGRNGGHRRRVRVSARVRRGPRSRRTFRALRSGGGARRILVSRRRRRSACKGDRRATRTGAGGAGVRPARRVAAARWRRVARDRGRRGADRVGPGRRARERRRCDPARPRELRPAPGPRPAHLPACRCSTCAHGRGGRRWLRAARGRRRDGGRRDVRSGQRRSHGETRRPSGEPRDAAATRSRQRRGGRTRQHAGFRRVARRRARPAAADRRHARCRGRRRERAPDLRRAVARVPARRRPLRRFRLRIARPHLGGAGWRDHRQPAGRGARPGRRPAARRRRSGALRVQGDPARSGQCFRCGLGQGRRRVEHGQPGSRQRLRPQETTALASDFGVVYLESRRRPGASPRRVRRVDGKRGVVCLPAQTPPQGCAASGLHGPGRPVRMVPLRASGEGRTR